MHVNSTVGEMLRKSRNKLCSALDYDIKNYAIKVEFWWQIKVRSSKLTAELNIPASRKQLSLILNMPGRNKLHIVEFFVFL